MMCRTSLSSEEGMFTPTSLHIWHLIDTLEVTGTTSNLAPSAQLSSDSCRDLWVLFFLFFSQLPLSLDTSNSLFFTRQLTVAVLTAEL